MIVIYLTPSGEQLQQAQHEIARAVTVEAAIDILKAADTLNDGIVEGTLQAVSDRTGYVFAERLLYRYPLEESFTHPLEGALFHHLAGMDGVDVPIQVLAMVNKHTARIKFLATDKPRGWKVGSVTECDTFQLL